MGWGLENDDDEWLCSGETKENETISRLDNPDRLFIKKGNIVYCRKIIKPLICARAIRGSKNGKNPRCISR